jgi:hypothetical protein
MNMAVIFSLACDVKHESNSNNTYEQVLDPLEGGFIFPLVTEENKSRLGADPLGFAQVLDGLNNVYTEFDHVEQLTVKQSTLQSVT